MIFLLLVGFVKLKNEKVLIRFSSPCFKKINKHNLNSGGSSSLFFILPALVDFVLRLVCELSACLAGNLRLQRQKLDLLQRWQKKRDVQYAGVLSSLPPSPRFQPTFSFSFTVTLYQFHTTRNREISRKFSFFKHLNKTPKDL